jgi:hypothetical protein
MKRWAGLLALFLLAAIGAVVIAPWFQPSEHEQRFAKIRVGMTKDDVEAIMQKQSGVRLNRFVMPAGHPSKIGEAWYWRCRLSRWGAGVEFVVKFDNTGRVAATAMGQSEEP